MRTHNKFFYPVLSIVCITMTILGVAFLPCLISNLAIAMLFGVAQKRDDEIIKLRTYATLSVSEWPEMSVQRFNWLLNISEVDIWQEDVKEYCDRQTKRRYFYKVLYDRGFPLFMTRLDWKGSPNESVSPFKTRNKIGLTANEASLQLMKISRALAFDESLIVPGDGPELIVHGEIWDFYPMWRSVKETAAIISDSSWSCEQIENHLNQ